jgi:dynein heavy chain
MKLKVVGVDNNGGCTSVSTHRSQVADQAEEIFNNSIIPQLYGLYRRFPASSCANIYQGHPSAYYWLNVTNEPQLVYCSLNENRCCGESDGKWMRIAFLNMSDPSAQCPDGWREVQSPIRTCRRQNGTNINSVNYNSYGIPYSRVCGRIVAYQFGTPEAFSDINPQVIDDAYVDGISITFGHPRNHIWTFAATIEDHRNCPCSTNRNTAPPFVGEDHFCEVRMRTTGIYFANNPLWDGQNCTSSSTCCEFNNPPWFCKQLNQTTTEDMEIRIMSSAAGDNLLEDEDVPIHLIEIYVQQ